MEIAVQIYLAASYTFSVMEFKHEFNLGCVRSSEELTLNVTMRLKLWCAEQ